MKIGIVTFQSVQNYGAALQCYALYQYLLQSGENVRIIRYQNPIMNNRYRLFPKFRKNVIKILPPYLYTLRHLNELKTRSKKFLQFLDNMQLTAPMTKQELIESDIPFDLLVSGSDQLWNPKITHGFDDVYFLNVKSKAYKVTYAMSMGNTQMQEFQNPRFAELINQLDAISMREKDAADFVSALTGNIAENVVDPTFLLSAKQWGQVASAATQQMSEKYLLFYSVKENPELERIAEFLADTHQLLLVYVNIKRKEPVKRNCRMKVLNDVGPVDFVSLIEHAQMVVTSSFHGMAFSCIFRKDLHIMLPAGTGARLMNLVEMFGIQNRIYNSLEHFRQVYGTEENAINYIDDCFQEAYEKSIAYLERVIHEASERNQERDNKDETI